MDCAQLTQWARGYEKARRTRGTDLLAKLFTNTTSPKNKEYRDLWIVRLNDAGLCFRLEEWPFWPTGAAGRRRNRGRVTL